MHSSPSDVLHYWCTWLILTPPAACLLIYLKTSPLFKNTISSQFFLYYSPVKIFNFLCLSVSSSYLNISPPPFLLCQPAFISHLCPWDRFLHYTSILSLRLNLSSPSESSWVISFLVFISEKRQEGHSTQKTLHPLSRKLDNEFKIKFLIHICKWGFSTRIFKSNIKTLNIH